MNYYYNPPKGSRARKDLEGGSLAGILGKLYGSLVMKWGKDGIKGLRDQRKEIKALEEAIKQKKQMKGGSGDSLSVLLKRYRTSRNTTSKGGHKKGKAVGGCAACKRWTETQRRASRMIEPEFAIYSPESVYKGGKITGRDVLDFFAGPIGWTMMGIRKSREKKIDKLKKELNGGMIMDPESYMSPHLRTLLMMQKEQIKR